ncbi:hypothetical protein [Tropicibacter sp. S64]|uniref:hypothetical protein n=1 Tax=Tropicibacter sp. S64 TaxID=3415122 RepID=UPI003C7D2912
MTLSPETFASCVTEANLAPSVHNVQPARWHQDGLRITLHCDPTVALRVADPEARDLLFSCGTALEGMVIALAHRGFGTEVRLLTNPGPGAAVAELQCRAQTPITDPLFDQIPRRRTCRSGFLPVPPESMMQLQTWAGASPDVHLITDPSAIGRWADENDRLSLDVFRDPAFRSELLSWMRLGRNHPRWSADGLNARAMDLGSLEALAVPLAMSGTMFRILDRFGLSNSLIAEAPKTRSASAILCLSAPEGQSELLSGRRYYRMTLELAALGLATWPMAVLVDTAEAKDTLHAELAIAANRQIRNCLRVGLASTTPPPAARRPIAELLTPGART